jgi:hypothetical protein
MPNSDLDQLAPAIAKWLAPYIATELGIQTPSAASANLSPDYDDKTAAEFVKGLGDEVLPRALVLFAILSATDKDHQIDSVKLAEKLRLSTPRNIASVLTNSLKRRAKKLGLPVPWTQSTTSDNRTLWSARDAEGEQAFRLMTAIETEVKTRGISLAIPDVQDAAVAEEGDADAA